jgi:hypothetical protein
VLAVLHLAPVLRPSGSIEAVSSLRHDLLKPQLARVIHDIRAVALKMFDELQDVIAARQKLAQPMLALDEG